jgi:hypothetical protein
MFGHWVDQAAIDRGKDPPRLKCTIEHRHQDGGEHMDRWGFPILIFKLCIPEQQLCRQTLRSSSTVILQLFQPYQNLHKADLAHTTLQTAHQPHVGVGMSNLTRHQWLAVATLQQRSNKGVQL